MKKLIFLIAGGLFAFAVGGVVGVAIYTLLVAAWFVGLFFSSLNSTLDNTDKKAPSAAAPATTGVAAGYVVTTYNDDSSLDDSGGGFDFGF